MLDNYTPGERRPQHNTGKILITGAAVRIGAALATACAYDGWELVLHYHRNAEKAENLARKLRQDGARLTLLQADLSSESDVKNLIAAASKDKPLTALINNASLFSYDDSASVSFDAINQHMMVNLAAPALLIRLFAEQCPPTEIGAVVNMLDAKLFGLNPDYYSYTLSKSALLCLNKISAQAYAPHIRVNGIAPGITLPSGGQTEAEFKKSHQRNLLGRGADISEIVAAMRLLLASRSITGEVVVLDGGCHLQPPARDVAFYEDSAK